MLKDELTQKIADALKKGDAISLSTYRLLYTALHNLEIAKQNPLTSEDEVQIIKRQIKQREEAFEAYSKAGRLDLAEKEQKEGEVLKEFLPEQASPEKIEEVINSVISETGSSSMSDYGRVMGAVMSKVGQAADGRVVGEMVKKKLGG